MRIFKNDIGCQMSFDDGISEEQIQMRLSIFSKAKWIEVIDGRKSDDMV